ncbi:helix-turn-helix domain-containing protein [Sulfoacidibacillus thermotolerans]|uniref:HTH cro/C1-type domain-containing protein n=1 Tax=Sulfoacidibacillus thermotolerans TaxID=1765684 RepID=A0A2U3CVY1_SULT2|nr:hypothetical protein BM613_13995 [Sulfoacidibacillus thermotolerans]
MSLFAERLALLRKNKGLTQIEMATALKITLRSYQRYEGKNREPQIDQLILIAKFFNTSIDYLVGLSDDPTPSQHRGSVSEISKEE